MTDTRTHAGEDHPSQDPANRVGYYHPATIVAHWTIVALLVMQFATGGGMERAFDAAAEGQGLIRLSGPAWVHGMIGSAIGLLMIWRLYIRLTHYVPPPPTTIPRVLQIVSRATHYALYTLLIAMPVAGLAAVFVKVGWLAAAHGLASKALLALVALHVAGGLYHAVRRDGVVKRMLRQDPAGQYDTRTDRPAA